jgi:hypothetical protein
MKNLVVIGDTHAGSIYGLHPPDFISVDDREVSQNTGQRYTWECWVDFWRKAKSRNPDVIIFNGDAIDGKQQAQHATECNLPGLVDQKNAAIATLEYAKRQCPNARWYFTQGTEYHEGKGAEALEDIASALGGTAYRGAGPGRLTREVLDLEIEGVVLNFAHHISATSGFYRATAADREGQWSAMSAKDSGKGVPKADALFRNHVHYFVHVEHASKHIVVVPCWQLQTRFMRKNSVYRMLPDIGGVFVTVDGKKKDRGEDPITIEKELYRLPAAPVTKFE